MTRLYLVRHGRASAGWNVDPDPGLDDVGRQQASGVAAQLAHLGAVDIVTSPLLRCRETADHIAERSGVEPRIEPAVAEIPSPDGVAMADRVEWLREAMAGTWSQLGEPYTGFRDGVVSALVTLPTDTVVASHFIAIKRCDRRCTRRRSPGDPQSRQLLRHRHRRRRGSVAVG